MNGSIKAIAYRNFLIHWKSDMLSLASSILSAFRFFLSKPHLDILLLTSLAIVQFNQERKIVELLVRDRRSKFKVVYTSMGLKRAQYLFTNCLYFIAKGLSILICYALVMMGFNWVFGIEIISEFECQYFALLTLNVVLSTFYSTSLSFMFRKVEVAKLGYQWLNIFLLTASVLSCQNDAFWPLWLFLPRTGVIVFIFGWIRSEFQSADFKVSLYLQAWQIAFYMTCAVYLENVRGRNDGFNRHPLYFLKWLRKLKKSKAASEESLVSNFAVDNPPRTVSEGITIRGVSKKFDAFTALKKISLDFEPGKIHCLLGQNGAGKSTLLNILAGVSNSTQGNIMFKGEDLKSLYKRQSRNLRVGICPPQDILFDEITVKQHLRIICYIKEIEQIDESIERSMSLVGLINFSKFPVRQLSGGFRRRLSLAMSLLGDPNLLLLDEPTSSIDPVLRRDFWNVLLEIKKTNKNLVTVLSTHHMEEAEFLADNIVIINRGTVEFQGTKKVMKDRHGFACIIKIFQQQVVQQFVLEEFLVNMGQSLGDLSSYVDDIKIKQNGMKFKISQSKEKGVNTLISTSKQHLPAGMEISFNSNALEQAYVHILKSIYKSSEPKRKAGLVSVLRRMYTEKPLSLFEVIRLIAEFKIRYIFGNKRDIIKLYLFVLNLVTTGFGFEYLIKVSNKEFYVLADGYYNSLIRFHIIYSAFAASTMIHNRFTGLTRLFYINRVPVAVYFLGNLLVDFLFATLEFSLLLLAFSVLIVLNEPILEEYQRNIFSSLLLIYAWKLTFSCSCTLYYRLFSKSKGSYFGIVYLLFDGVLIFLSENVSDKFYYLSETGLLRKALKNPDSLDLTYFLVLFAMASIYLIITISIDEYNLRHILKKKGEGPRISEMDPNKIDENSSYNFIKENLKATVRTETDRTLNNTPKFLEVRALSKTYSKKITVLKDVTFSIKSGVSFGLVGPNGAGKSTLINIIFGHIAKTKGCVRVDGEADDKGIFSSILGPNIFYSSRLAACFQENALWRDLSVKYNLFFFAKLHKIQIYPLLELLRYFELDQCLDMKARFLSCGNKRKLCTLMSLLINPNLIVFDEATCGVDLSTKLTLKTVLKYLRRQNKASVLISTHFLKDTQIYCNKIGIIDKGEFLCIGDLGELKARFGGYLAALTFPSLIFKRSLLAELSEIATVKVFREESEGLRAKYILTDIKSSAELLLRLLSAEEDGSLERLSLNELSIEDIYIDLFRDSSEPWV
jgi:ABC-type multidrug transport system ATPase subunit